MNPVRFCASSAALLMSSMKLSADIGGSFGFDSVGGAFGADLSFVIAACFLPRNARSCGCIVHCINIADFSIIWN